MAEAESLRPAVEKLKGHYRTGRDDLGEDFFGPCLFACTSYDRAAGYFTSQALVTWSSALPRIAADTPVKIRLLISPNLTPEDRRALELATDPASKAVLCDQISDRMMEEALDFSRQPHKAELRLRLLAWMVATERLELRFAFPTHVSAPGLFHEKIGIFVFPWEESVAFTGSANETTGGHTNNYESVDVYRSWVGSDAERVAAKQEQFEEAWEGTAQGLEVRRLSKASLAYVVERAPEKRPNLKIPPPEEPEPDPRWRHQDEAIDSWLETGRGVLEMATGTGKTRTALRILSKLDLDEKIDSVIVATKGNDLLDQWGRELDRWATQRSPRCRVLRHYDRHHDLNKFALDPERAVALVSWQKLGAMLRAMDQDAKRRTILVHDEIHGLGSPANRADLAGEHASLAYTLGLSATPEREYDIEGTQFILNEVGNVVFSFGLEDAIERGILCEFDYVPLSYQLTTEDREDRRNVYRWAARQRKEGRPVTNEQIWTRLARVYKLARQKPIVFSDYLSQHPEIVKSTIVFVETREFAEPILSMLHRHTHLYRTYFAEDDRDHLQAFGQGQIDTLVTCHRISQGIDIRRLKNVVLFASARAKLETIQRIGRCLRSDPANPEKRAMVVDFIRDDGDPEEGDTGDEGHEDTEAQGEEQAELTADQERCEWLTRLSQVRRKE